MKKNDYKDHLAACKTEAVESRRKYSKIWDECWDIYRNKQDYSKKEFWQSQICIPEGQAALRKAQGIIRSSLTKPKDFFDIEHGSNPQAADHVKLRMMNQFRNQDVNFVTNFVEGVGASLVFGVGCIKHYYKTVTKRLVEGQMEQEPVTDEFGDQVVDPRTGMPRINQVPKTYIVDREMNIPCYEVKDPRTTYFLVEDPYKFIIEEEVFDLAEVQKWADLDGYDAKEIKKLKGVDYGKSPNDEVQERLNAIEILDHSNQYRKQVLVQRYWGEVCDENGEIVHKAEDGSPVMVQYAIANENYLIYPPKEIPYWHGKLPFVIWSPLSVVLRKTGQSMIESMRTIQRAINNIVNLQVDALIYELLGIPEIDTDKLLNPAEVSVLVPGRLIRRKSGSTPGPAVTIDRPSSFSNAPVHMVEFLRRAAQNAHFVTDILMGLNTVKGEQATATEISKKGAESAQAFQVISMDIEDNALVPLLEMTAVNMLQYDDFIDVNEPELVRYKAMDRPSRVLTLQGPFRFTARGITSHFEQVETVNKLASVLQLLKQIPSAQIAVKWNDIIRVLFENSQIPNAEQLVLTDEQIEQKQQAMRQQQEQAQMKELQAEMQNDERDRQNEIQKQLLESKQEMQELIIKGKQALDKEKLKIMGELQKAIIQSRA